MATAKERPTGTRKEWKAAGRKMLRKNYLMIILLCLISIYFTGEFGYIRHHETGGSHRRYPLQAERRR